VIRIASRVLLNYSFLVESITWNIVEKERPDVKRACGNVSGDVRRRPTIVVVFSLVRHETINRSLHVSYSSGLTVGRSLILCGRWEQLCIFGAKQRSMLR